MIVRANERKVVVMVGLVGAAMLVLSAAPAAAKDTMAIRADVRRTCNFAVLPMMFGMVSVTRPRADAEASVIIDCTPDTAYRVTMDNGQNFRGGTRRMANPLARRATAFLDYEIYRDAARTRRWGATLAASVSGVAPAGGRVVLYAYGRTADRRSAAGAYQDVITVTLTF